MSERTYEPVYISKDTLDKGKEDSYVQMLAENALKATQPVYEAMVNAGVNIEAVSVFSGENYTPSFKVEVEAAKKKGTNELLVSNGQQVYNITAKMNLGEKQSIDLHFKVDNPDNASVSLSSVTAASYVKQKGRTQTYHIAAANVPENQYLSDNLKLAVKTATEGLDKDMVALRGAMSELKALGVSHATLKEGGKTENGKEFGPSIEVFTFDNDGAAWKANLGFYTIKEGDDAGKTASSAYVECIGEFKKDEQGNIVKGEKGRAEIDETTKGGGSVIKTEYMLLDSFSDAPSEIKLAVASFKGYDTAPYKAEFEQDKAAREADKKADKNKEDITK